MDVSRGTPVVARGTTAILTVTPNPALDLTWHVERLKAGEVHRAPTALVRAGGKGINVARVLYETGNQVLALTTGHEDDEFAAELTASGIPHELVPARGRMRRSAGIVDVSNGCATVLNEPGSTLSSDEVRVLVTSAGELGRRAKVVAISGSLPPGFSPEHLGELVGELVRADVPTIVDTSGIGLMAAARAGATVLKPNHEELRAITGLDDPIAGAQSLLDAGARLVVVSLGRSGLILHGHTYGIRARLPRELRGNPTGAGDAVVAAICTALTDQPRLADIADATPRLMLARRAIGWSASVVQMPMAGSLGPDWRALENEAVIELKESRA